MLKRNPTDGNNGQLAIVPSHEGFSVAKVELREDRPHLQLCNFTPWNTHDTRGKQIARQATRLRLKKRPCATVMGLEDYSILSVEAPSVPDDELSAALRWQIKDLVDFDIEEAIIEVFPAPSGSGLHQKKQIYVVVAAKKTLQSQVDLLKLAQTRLNIIDIPELVLKNIATFLPEDEGGVAMVYLTADRGMVLISRHGQLYFARTMDIGSDALMASRPPAEGLSLSDDSSQDRMVLEIQRSLDYYDRYFSQPPIAGIVFTPLPVAIPGLFDYIHQSLGITVRELDLDEFMTLDTPIKHEQQAQCLVAIGAALRRTGDT